MEKYLFSREIVYVAYIYVYYIWFQGDLSPACLEDIVVSEIEADEEVHQSSSGDDSDLDSDND